MIKRALSNCLWRLPGRFAILDRLGGRCSLRSVLFHDVSGEETEFTGGLGVTMRPDAFESRVAFLNEHYTPVTFDQVLNAAHGGELPPRALLVTFDDAYSSVVEEAVPVLEDRGIPSLFFVNSSFVDCANLGMDNLFAFALNTKGMGLIEEAVERAGLGQWSFHGLAEVIQGCAARLSGTQLARVADEILAALGTDPLERARDESLYMTRDQLRSLPSKGVEVGNHTRTHRWCRSLDGPELEDELAGCRADLESLIGRPVRSFSVPYGSSMDLTPEVSSCLADSGHELVFLVEGTANRRAGEGTLLDRVSLSGSTDSESFTEIEVLPRMRQLRNRLRHNG